jgi:hypothetical protein
MSEALGVGKRELRHLRQFHLRAAFRTGSFAPEAKIAP